VNRYSVIIPTLNEARRIALTISSVYSILPSAEIIVADGGSSDKTVFEARRLCVRIVHSERSRGIQCNAGARDASWERLLFLHADTQLPPNALPILDHHFQDPGFQIGTFRLQFDHPHWLLRAYAAFTRFDSMFTRFGDQCIVVRKSFFDALGGFPDWPLFEDVQLLRSARRLTTIVSFPASVVTSARRFSRLGMLRAQWLNVRLFARYLLHTPPERLAELYRDSAEKWEAEYTKFIGT
jgi:rSAM/selenodomain-associated transferase 2